MNDINEMKNNKGGYPASEELPALRVVKKIKVARKKMLYVRQM